VDQIFPLKITGIYSREKSKAYLFIIRANLLYRSERCLFLRIPVKPATHSGQNLTTWMTLPIH